MSFRTTAKQVEAVFTMRYVPAMRRAGFDVTGWTLHKGSSTNGIQWKIQTKGDQAGMPSMIHLGLTAGEAWNMIHAMAQAVEFVNALNDN
jgi:hypothetical protein